MFNSHFRLGLAALALLATVPLISCGTPVQQTDAGEPCAAADDGNDCTEDVCVSGVLEHPNRAAGASCSSTGGAVCDGAGHCVGCLEDAQCTAPKICQESARLCVDPACDDDEKNGSETAADCGGSCAPAKRCADGLGCLVAGDCQSGVCGNDKLCAAARCGDGVTQAGETCDDGNAANGDGCDDGVGGNCRPSGCGNGVTSGSEACDDGNTTNADGCDNNCTVSACGNGLTAGSETCDDGNTGSGDGCSQSCAVESGFTCQLQPSQCATTCGDGIQAGTEACDDAPPAEAGDGCSLSCTVESGYVCTGSPSTCATMCGDGMTGGAEVCDDGNMTNGDGCDDGALGNCKPTGCGNGVVTSGETCDDGNSANGDGCDDNCTASACGNGVVAGTEACDDNGLVAGDGCSALCAVEPGFNCSGRPSTCTTTCGDGIKAGTEACDDAPPAESGDGCSASCTVEPGFVCSGAPSVCATVCGDGVIGGAETCDDSGASGGDGCSANCTIESGYACTGQPSVCATVCGDGIVSGAEACDDGCLAGAPNVCEASDNGDGCSATCVIECGDGALGPSEECDDGNRAAGDGCSASCAFEVTCAAGQNLVKVRSTDVPKSIPDNNTLGVDSNVDIPASNVGSVRKVVVGIGRVVHTYDADLTLALLSPAANLKRRDLVVRRGGSGDNFIATLFDDAAATSITAGTPPFRGAFRPEQLLSDPTGYVGMNAAGIWRLRAADGASGDTGVVESWTLALCVDPTAVCGNGALDVYEECDDGNQIDTDACSNTCQLFDGCGDGNLDSGEQCDDDNVVSGDGCSATCQVDISCAAGETAVIVGNANSVSIPDNQLSGVQSPVTVTQTGAVTRAVVHVGSITHTADSDLDVYLDGPSGLERELSTDNGGTNDNYLSTDFDDGAATPITTGTAPFTKRFRPEQSLSTTAGVDFRQLNAAGTWNLRVADDTALQTGTLDAWTLALCVNPNAAYCGDATKNAAEECDDGNAVNSDACNNLCQVADGCGDGNLDTGEQCDDDNLASGDGCSTSCTLEFSCGTGETAVIATSTTQVPVPDNVLAGVQSSVTVTQAGSVARAIVYLGGITHTNDADLDLYLDGPTGLERELSTDNGGTGDNYRNTTFDDLATQTVTTGTAPFSSRFRPELSLSTTAGTDFRQLRAAGTWSLRVADDLATQTGTLEGWTLALCLNQSAAYCGDGIVNGADECDDGNLVDTDACNTACRIVDGCGDGNVDSGEHCDDDNLVSGDGCSASCQLEISCGTGETAVVVANTSPMAIPDFATAGVLSPVTVSVTGAVTRALVYVGGITHPNDADLDIFLVGPNGLQRELSTDNGGAGDNYRGTYLDDTAATTVLGATAPFTGRFRPEFSLSTTPGADFRQLNAAGTWSLRVADDQSTQTGTLDAWALGLCVNQTSTYCGDGSVNGSEECDDGNLINTDACTNNCQLTDGCGDGNIDGTEECDDDNFVSGDGCSATCVSDISCGSGETAVILRSTTPALIPDGSTGVLSPLTVATTGLVRKAIATVSITHARVADLDVSLLSPHGSLRDLSSDQNGINYVKTIFTDSAASLITAGAAPFTGPFRPEQPLYGFGNQTAAGTWNLYVFDDATGTTGTVDAWTLALCVDPTANSVCGNGVVEAGETCDDLNAGSGDGCSSTCQVELSCPAGQTLVTHSASSLGLVVPDGTPTGVSHSFLVTATGNVTKAVVVVGTVAHSFDADLDLSLTSPAGTVIDLSSDNGSSGDDYVSTIFDDAAPGSITLGQPPFRGRHRPESALNVLNGQAAAGTWTFKVVDDLNPDPGVLQSWSLHLCTQ